MKNFRFPAVAIALGAICAVLLVWLWRADLAGARQEHVARAASAVKPAVTQADVSVDIDAVTRSLLVTLERLLSRSDTRAREGLLTFKDEAAYRRFLARSQKSGLNVLGQLDALRTVRVRYDAFSSLRGELLANAADYSGVSANNLVAIPGPPPKVRSLNRPVR